MKKIMLIIVLGLIVMINSCSEEGKIGVALLNSDELSTGDNVPFLLHQNYPNPFNPTTSIRLDVSITMKLKLTVLTSDWIEVKTLLNEPIGPGIYSDTYDAHGIASGDYFYTLEGGGHMQIRKMKIAK